MRAQRRGQMLRVNSSAFGKNIRMLHRVAKLAHVARPSMREQRGHRAVVELRRSLALCGGEVLQKKLREERNFRRSLAKRRNLEHESVEPIKKIFAKTSLRNLLFEIAIRCGDHAHVDGDVAIGSDARDGARLEHS